MYEKAINFMKNKKGFTLVELVIVILIIAILFVVLIPQLSTMTNKAKTAGVQEAFREYQIAAQTVAYEQSGFNLDADDADSTKVMDELNANLDAVNKLEGKDAAPVISREDPWGNAYTATIAEDAVTFTSAGADGVLADDAATTDVDESADNLSTTIKYEAGSVVVETDGFSLNAVDPTV